MHSYCCSQPSAVTARRQEATRQRARSGDARYGHKRGRGGTGSASRGAAPHGSLARDESKPRYCGRATAVYIPKLQLWVGPNQQWLPVYTSCNNNQYEEDKKNIAHVRSDVTQTYILRHFSVVFVLGRRKQPCAKGCRPLRQRVRHS